MWVLPKSSVEKLWLLKGRERKVIETECRWREGGRME